MTERLLNDFKKITDNFSFLQKSRHRHVALAYAPRRPDHLHRPKSIPHNLNKRREDNMSSPRDSSVRLSTRLSKSQSVQAIYM